MRGLLLLACVAFGCRAWGLSTAYMTFDHPDGWRCELSQGVWICQSTLENDRKESVVLSIATMATEWDTLDNYENYLKQPRPIQDEDGNTLMSKITYARGRNINGTTWVDSLQFNSELPGFWARYVATVHNKLAILITYIVSEQQYQKLAPQFERMISSLKPNAEFDLNVASKQGDSPLPGASKLGPGNTKDIIAQRLRPIKREKKDAVPEEASGGGMRNLLLAVGGVAAVVLLLARARRRKKGAGKKPPTAGKEPTSLRKQG